MCRRRATTAEWVVLRPILEACDIDPCYKIGGRRQEPWWRKMAARNQWSATLKDFLAEARERRWKSGRRGRGRRDMDAEDSKYGTGSDGYWDAGTEKGDTQVGK